MNDMENVIAENMSTTRTVEFDGNYLRRQYRLMEVDESFLTEWQRDGMLWVKAAAATDEAVVCTRTATFRLRAHDSSNTAYVTDASQPGLLRVLGQFDGVWELARSAPKLDSLRTLLSSAPLDEAEAGRLGPDPRASALRLEALEEVVPCSEMELAEALQNLEAFSWHGHWRVFEPAFRAVVVDELMTAIAAQEFPLKAVPVSEAPQLLPTRPAELAEIVLRQMGTVSRANAPSVCVDPTKVWGIRLRAWLRKAPSSFLLESELLQRLLAAHELDSARHWPRPTLKDVELGLLGHAYRERRSPTEVVWHMIQVDALSYDPVRRVEQLLELKRSYEEDELKALLAPSCRDSAEVDSLITFHFRRVRIRTDDNPQFVRK